MIPNLKHRKTKMKILIIGQCTLHWGRMEFGNIGNYYIIEPFIRELHLAFPESEIRTTFQMSKRFCDSENITVIPMELYYGWNNDELTKTQQELAISEKYKLTGQLDKSTPYIQAVEWADLVIDFSGDIWGDNANFLGADRFMVGLLKDQIAMNLGKKVVMLAGSPGPFTDKKTKDLAKKVYQQFDLVTNREPISKDLLEKDGFDVTKTQSLACPAFLFEPAKGNAIKSLLNDEGLSRINRDKPIVGFILCGWNFEDSPFDKWPRKDSEYVIFAEAIEFLTEILGVKVCLMSHSNGFEVPVTDFKLNHGRDYPIIKQLERVISDRGISKDIFSLNGIYDAWQTKAIIGSFDMLVSGRVHAAVAGLSQNIPTVIIDYGHEPKAHKLLGFATVAGAQDYIADPSSSNSLKEIIKKCWGNKVDYKEQLEKRIPKVKEEAKMNFKLLNELM